MKEAKVEHCDQDPHHTIHKHTTGVDVMVVVCRALGLIFFPLLHAQLTLSLHLCNSIIYSGYLISANEAQTQYVINETLLIAVVQ